MEGRRELARENGQGGEVKGAAELCQFRVTTLIFRKLVLYIIHVESAAMHQNKRTLGS